MVVAIEEIIHNIHKLMWSNTFIFICLATGLYFSLRTRFLQVRHLGRMIKYLFVGTGSKSGISSFQSFAMGLAGRVGTGNIAGVGAAIAFGGPGAIFWMWAIAFLGAGSAFVESTLGQIYKTQGNGEYVGGPAFYISKGTGQKWFGVLFALVTAVALGICLPGVQSYSMTSALELAFDVPKWIAGIIIVGAMSLVIVGGIKRLASVAEAVVPLMAGLYILFAMIIMIIKVDQVPEVFRLILSSAFGKDQFFGGMLGSAIMWGVKRGIYSNEAGQGTGAHAAAAAEVDHPAKQGLVQAFSVYVDTLFVCSATAFMILSTNCYNVIDHATGAVIYQGSIPEATEGGSAAFTQFAVDSVFSGLGTPFVAVALSCFAFTALLSHYYMAETNVKFLTKNKFARYGFALLFLAATFYGSVRSADLAWTLGDIGVAAMAYLNIVAMYLLQRPAIAALKDFERQLKAGAQKFNFNPRRCGIKGADFWEKKS